MLRKSCSSHFFNGIMNGYAPEYVRKDVQKRYKEYDSCYLGYYSQWFFWFFCVFGIVIFGLVIFLMLDTHYHWTK